MKFIQTTKKIVALTMAATMCLTNMSISVSAENITSDTTSEVTSETTTEVTSESTTETSTIDVTEDVSEETITETTTTEDVATAEVTDGTATSLVAGGIDFSTITNREIISRILLDDFWYNKVTEDECMTVFGHTKDEVQKGRAIFINTNKEYYDTEMEMYEDPDFPEEEKGFVMQNLDYIEANKDNDNEVSILTEFANLDEFKAIVEAALLLDDDDEKLSVGESKEIDAQKNVKPSALSGKLVSSRQLWRGTSFTYSAWSTAYYSTNGAATASNNNAYCVNPSKGAPTCGGASFTTYEITNDDLRRIMYFSPGAPGYYEHNAYLTTAAQNCTSDYDTTTAGILLTHLNSNSLVTPEQ